MSCVGDLEKYSESFNRLAARNHVSPQVKRSSTKLLIRYNRLTYFGLTKPSSQARVLEIVCWLIYRYG
jgi:hypothetical protein